MDFGGGSFGKLEYRILFSGQVKIKIRVHGASSDCSSSFSYLNGTGEWEDDTTIKLMEVGAPASVYSYRTEPADMNGTVNHSVVKVNSENSLSVLSLSATTSPGASWNDDWLTYNGGVVGSFLSTPTIFPNSIQLTRTAQP